MNKAFQTFIVELIKLISGFKVKKIAKKIKAFEKKYEK
jgi:hypothetical protein